MNYYRHELQKIQKRRRKMKNYLMRKTLVGLAVEKYVDIAFFGDEYEEIFHEEPCEKTRYSLIFSDGWILKMWDSDAICLTGSRIAKYGNWRWIKERIPFSHTPKGGRLGVVIDGEEPDEEDCDGFIVVCTEQETIASAYNDGGDSFYPNGFVEVNMSLFVENARAMKNRPVWIFVGDSGLGKSTLGSDLVRAGKIIFETDTCNRLPEEIWADVIVAGKRRGGFSIEQIKKALPRGTAPIIVNFEG